jgi:hypothetical protein
MSRVNDNKSPTYVVPNWNPTHESFLFVFAPHDIAKEACCGCSLKTGVQIISLFYIVSNFSSFINTISSPHLLPFILSGIGFALYLIGGICLINSTMSYSYKNAYTGYFIYTILFLINLIDSIIVGLLLFSGYYGKDVDYVQAGLIYCIAIIIVVAIHVYLLWIIFSFTVHLKHKRLALIQGDIYKSYEDFAGPNERLLPNTNNPNNVNIV